MSASYREICIRADLLAMSTSLESTVAHELTHVFQYEAAYIGSLSLEGSATAVDMIITHESGYGQLIGSVDYTAIAPDNGPAIYLDSQIAAQQYALSNPLEKLYAYKPTFFREWTSQPSLEGTDPYLTILGNAVLDSKPLTQWLRDQGLETSNLQDGIYAETYAALYNNQAVRTHRNSPADRRQHREGPTTKRHLHPLQTDRPIHHKRAGTDLRQRQQLA